MNQDLLKKWIQALRSGEYKQGRNFLNREDEFCASGVLCDVYAKENGIKWKKSRYDNKNNEILGMSRVIPKKIKKLLMDEDESLTILYDGQERQINYLNDHETLSFEEIADMLERQLAKK
jgi:hypothetical protein